MQIREARLEDSELVARLVSESNKDVAAKFGLTADNCPKHPSFCTAEWTRADLERGVRYFILEKNGEPIACVAFENPSAELAYLNRLSVLPEHRRQGAGAYLVQHIIQLAESCSIPMISIGVIGEYGELRHWYQKLGFQDGVVKHFSHLPFSVRYMSYRISRPNC